MHQQPTPRAALPAIQLPAVTPVKVRARDAMFDIDLGANGDTWALLRHGPGSGDGRITHWHVSETRRDDAGRMWQRNYPAVVDDFGSLVEVAQ